MFILNLPRYSYQQQQNGKKGGA
eukprot:COSAG06_NODE_15710_length_1051_cov_1.054622_1_plen_22_part_10